MSDHVRDLLDRLDNDVARLGAGDVASVRSRGDQRRRRQGALVVAGSAVAVAAVALLPWGLDAFAHADRAPAASTGPSTSPSAPSPSGSASTGKAFVFLTPGQLPEPATGGQWQVVEAQAGSAVAKCVDPAPTGPSTTSARWFATGSNPKPGDEIAVERWLTYDSVDQASAAVTSLVAHAKACAYNSDPVLTSPAGDEAMTLYFRYDDGLVDAASMQSLVVVRVGTQVAVLTVAMDGNGDIPYIDDLQQHLPRQLAEQLKASTA